jgi:hypothetical protein
MVAPTPAQAEALKSRIGAILMSESCQTIDFWLDGQHIDGSGLSYVALALKSMSFDINPDPGPNVGAGYMPLTNTFVFKSVDVGGTLRQRMHIVHECTHALRDAKGKLLRTADGGRTPTRALSDEACAYVAGMLYYILESAGMTGTPVAPIWAASIPVHRTAFFIAFKVRGQLGEHVSARDADAMRTAIRNDPVYANLRADPDALFDANGLPL